MSIRTRVLFFAAAAALFASSAFAQTWGLGASLGAVNDVSHRFAFDEFHSRDLNGWVQYELEEHVQLRATYGSMKTPGGNSERRVETSDGRFLTTLGLKSRVDYGTLGVSYEFFEGDFTSGIFGGLGGYKIRAEPAPAGLEEFSDPNQTVLGWHGGVDGSFQILAHLAFIARFEVHGFHAAGSRVILTTGGGLVYRF